MADYFTLIDKAIAGLPEQSSETRRAVYDRARMALLKQLRAIQPALPEKDITRERLALEEAIRKIEFNLASIRPVAQKPLQEQVTAAVNNSDVVSSPVDNADDPNDQLYATTEIIDEPLPPPPVIEHHVVDVAEPVTADDNYYQQSGRVKFDHPPETGAISRKKYPLLIGGVIAALLIAVGVWFVVAPTKQAPVAKPIAVAPETPPIVAEKKVEQRVAQDAPTVSVPTPAAPAPVVQIKKNSRVILFEETTGGAQQGIVVEGLVNWSLNGGTDPIVRGELSIPDRKIKMTIKFSLNRDKTLPASHLIEISLEPNSAAKITQMPGLLMKIGEQTRGQPISAQSVKITDISYLIGLSAIDADITRNVELIKEWGFLDFPVEFDSRRRAVLTLEKGQDGEKAFSDAFKAWGQ